MSLKEVQKIFADAHAVDKTLRCSPECLRLLSRKRIRASNYSREYLFRNMADGRVSLFLDYPSPCIVEDRGSGQAGPGVAVVGWLRDSDEAAKYRVKTGKSETFKYYTLREIADKWMNRKALMSVTDLHIRGTRLEKYIDPGILSTFNLYCECDEAAASLEMMTLVVSSRGNVSDSHSDDSDGSNHCFVGKKLWLAWDTHEGLAQGLQDVERVPVSHRARFNMETFLSLRSACWFTVEDGCTLFLPGHLTHKVITLENYVGVGSFYVAPANYLRTLSRWMTHSPNWQRNEPAKVNRDLVDNLADTFKNTIRAAGKKRCRDWGLDFVPYSIQSWKRHYNTGSRRDLTIDPGFEQCLRSANELAPT